MPLFVLANTPAGYGLFKAADKKLLKRDNLAAELNRPEKVVEMLKLKSFVKYESAALALEEISTMQKGQVPPILTSILEDLNKESNATLAVADVKLGKAIKELPQFDVKAVAGSQLGGLYRSIRMNMESLIPGLSEENFEKMALGLAHSISRHKVKYSSDKIDSMITHTVKTLDDMDKESNVYAMRMREWYNWHFPELAKILNDNIAYARVIIAGGRRASYADADLSEILPEEVETQVKEVAQRSMGTDITDDDLINCQQLAQQVVSFHTNRKELSNYLESRMKAIAPNLTALVGFLVGARLVSHVGSLVSLAKSPASTIQILGAEKALFRALKTKHDTPKYGLIYHSSLVGQATGKNKGKIARMLAAKAALGIRVDSMDKGDGEGSNEDYEVRASMGMGHRIKLENRLRMLEGKPALAKGVVVGPDGQVMAPGQFTLRETRRYNADADGVDAPAATNGTSKKDKKLIQVVDEVMKDADDSEDDSEDEGNQSTVAKLSDADYKRLAALAEIPVKKFKRKYERGDIQLGEDGTPRVFSKKELKKLRKAEAKAAESAPKVDAAETAKSSKKRKHEEDVDGETPRKEKKKKSKKST